MVMIKVAPIIKTVFIKYWIMMPPFIQSLILDSNIYYDFYKYVHVEFLGHLKIAISFFAVKTVFSTPSQSLFIPVFVSDLGCHLITEDKWF